METHDDLVRCRAVLAARSLDLRPRSEQIIPELAQLAPGQIAQVHLDLVHGRLSRLLVDVVVHQRMQTMQPFVHFAVVGMALRHEGHPSLKG